MRGKCDVTMKRRKFVNKKYSFLKHSKYENCDFEV